MSDADLDRVDAEILEVFVEELVEQLDLLARRRAVASTRELSRIVAQCAASGELVGAASIAASGRRAADLLARDPTVTAEAAAATREWSEQVLELARQAGFAPAERMRPVVLDIGSGVPEKKPWWRFW